MTHPHHISHLSIDENGWIFPPSKTPSENDTDVSISPKCHQLLTELKFSNLQSNDFFSGATCQTCLAKEDVDMDALQNLPKSNKLSDLLRAVIADVRRMGGPSSRDLDRNDNDDNNNDKNIDGDGEMKVVQNKKKGRRRKGRVAQLEKQQRLRQEQEAQRAEKSNVEDDDDNEIDDDSGDENKDKDVQSSGNDVNVNESDDSIENSDQRLANTFNTLRVLITILRPILDHPHHNDASLGMKHKSKKKKVDYYMISSHIYSAVSKGEWNDTRISFFRMLNEVEPGLGQKVMKRTSDDKEYVFDVKEWVVSLFNHDQLSSTEYVAMQCIGQDLLEACKASNHASHKFNTVLLERFQNDDEKKQRMLQESIRNLQVKLTKTINRTFPDVRLTVYGSCLSGLALEGSHDVDVSVYIPELDHLKQDFDAGVISAHQYEQKMKRTLFRIKGLLQRSESFVEVFAIAHARVPVVKGRDVRAKNPYEEDGSLSFDMCFLNDIAVVNSSLLREYSLFDNRVRILMLSIKSFAKLNNIASAANGTLSSYSWLNLVVFYLQCIGFLPTLQCPKLMEEHNFTPDPKGNRWHSINSLETFYLTEKVVTNSQIWKQPNFCSDVNLPVLLYGFFNFYSNVFPQQTIAASIRLGQMSLQKTSFKDSSKLWRMCIEDCFETYYSHCPHDLGCHLKERGQEQMLLHMDEMTNDLEYLLKQGNVADDVASKFVGLFFSDTGSKSKPKVQPPKSTFKGRCDNCQQVGHKRVDCPLKNKNGQNQAEKNNNFKGRCNNCQQTGHKKVDCPKLKSNEHDNSGGGNHGKQRGSGKHATAASNKSANAKHEDDKRDVAYVKEKAQQQKRNRNRKNRSLQS